MTSTAIAKKPLRQVETVQELLINDMAKQQLAVVAAEHMKPDRMMRLIANAMRTTPQLAECAPLSLLGSMMTCASIGLEPNTVLGHAYLIPFKNNRKNITEVQLVIGYKGMIDLARRSGAVVSIHADVVYAGDEFEYEYGSNQHLRHVPRGKREDPTHAYCHAKLTDGEAFIVLPWDVVLATREQSQGYRMAKKYGRKDNPWISHLHQMARKTAVRALFNELPISIEKVTTALEVDDQRTDYRAFAMDPTSGITIEGEASAADESEGEPDAPAEEKPKTAAKKGTGSDKPAATGKTKAKAADPAPESEDDTAEPEGEGEEVLPPEIESVRDRLVTDFGEIEDAGEIEATLELFSDQVELMREAYPGAHEAVQQAADAARERLAGA